MSEQRYGLTSMSSEAAIRSGKSGALNCHRFEPLYSGRFGQESQL